MLLEQMKHFIIYLKLTESRFEVVYDILDGVDCLLGVAENFEGINLGVLAAVESFAARLPNSSRKPLTDNSVNLWFK